MSNSLFLESMALLEFHKANCKKFMQNVDSAKEIDYINFLISLHIVLEISLNTFYRQLFHYISAPSSFMADRLIINEEIDSISYIDKTRFFIYCLPFHFPETEKARNPNTLIKKLKLFGESRNKLLHGYSISTFIEGGVEKWSKAKKNVTFQKCVDQLISFNKILDIISYYLDYLALENVKDSLRKDLKGQHLEKFYVITKH